MRLPETQQSLIMTTLYGIPNCDTVKKARLWLAGAQIDYTFSDFKKEPPTVALIECWLRDIPLDVLLNKRGTTWRALSDEQKQSAETQQGAVALMVAQPSLIKRPVLAYQQHYHASFQTDFYATLFHKE